MLPAAGLVLFLVAAGLREIKPLRPREDTPVKLEIIDLSQLEPPKPIVPEQPTPPKPLPAAPKLAAPKPQPTPVRPQQTPRTQMPSMPSPEPTPAAAAQPVVPSAPSSAATVAAPTPTPTAPAAPAQPVPRADVEAEFIGRVRAYLNSVKRYPTGREASLQRPQGTVKVWFVLSRDGSVVDTGIEESSNSMLLDQAARKSVGMGSFPAFPEQFRPGQAQHRFVVDLQFTPASG